MQWIKAHTDIVSDAKLGLIAKQTGLRPGDVLGVWMMILFKASDNSGDAAGFNVELADYTLKLKTGKTTAIIQAMQALDMLDGMYVVNWAKRQGQGQGQLKARSEKMAGYERVKRYRERKRNAAANDNGNDNAPVTHDNGNDNALRREEIKKRREDIKTPQPPTGGTVCENPPPSLPEKKPDGKPGPVPDMEFVQLRNAWDEQLRPEGPRDGWKEFLAVKRARDWPGLCAILDDIARRLDGGYWREGYEPGLARYLYARTWQQERTSRCRCEENRAADFVRYMERKQAEERQQTMEEAV